MKHNYLSRTAVLLAAVLMLGTLGGCGSRGGSSSETSTSTSAADTSSTSANDNSQTTSAAESQTTAAETSATESKVENKGGAKVVMLSSDDTKTSGVAAEFELKIKSDAKDGSYPVYIEELIVTTSDGDSIDAKAVDGKIVVGSDDAPETSKDKNSMIVSSAAGKAGDTIKVTVTVSDVDKFAGFDGVLVFDKDAFEVVSASCGSDFSGSLFQSNLEYFK